MDVHRLPAATVVLEGPTRRWWSQVQAKRLGSPWVHAWLLADAWTGVEARPGGVRTFDPLERFRQLEQGRAFVLLADLSASDAERAAIGAAARGLVGLGYGWLEWLQFAAFRRIAGGQRGRVICSRLVTLAWEAATGRHPWSDDAGRTLGASDRRKGFGVPGDFVAAPSLSCIGAAPGVGVGESRLPGPVHPSPWGDRYPLGSPRPERPA